MGLTCIRSVLLFDGENVRPNANVMFDSDTGLITSVSDHGQSIPQDVTTIDGAGHTLIPGLVESHMHLHALHMPKGIEESALLDTALKCGVTTVCDMHTETGYVHTWRGRVSDDLEHARQSGSPVKYPDIKSSLLGATIKGGWPEAIMRVYTPKDVVEEHLQGWPNVAPESAREFVSRHKAAGADYIKLMQEDMCCFALPHDGISVASLDLQISLSDAGHDQGLIVVGHALSVDMTEVILKSGADGLTHTFMDQAPPESVIDLYKRTNAFVIPTLSVLSSITTEEQARREKFANIAHGRGILSDPLRDIMVDTMRGGSPQATVRYAFDTIKRLRQENIDIVAGTDSIFGLKGLSIGPSLWMELEMYVTECGMSPLEALRSATAVPARRFKFDDRGIIAVGKRADLVLVKGNVINDIGCLWQDSGIVSVWKQAIKA